MDNIQIENIQIERSDNKGFNMKQVQPNPDLRISIQKVENEYKIPLSPTKITSPRLFDVPRSGIELLENPSRKRESSMDFSGISEDNFDIPIEDFTDVRKNIEGNRTNLFEFIQKKDASKDSKDKLKKPPSPSQNIFGPVRDKLRPNLGKETLQDMSFPSLDFSIDQNLGNEMNFSMDDMNKNLGSGPDPFDISNINLNSDPPKPETQEQPPPTNDKQDNVDDLEKMNIDELLSECQTLKEKHGINTPQHFNRKTPADEVRCFIRRERKKREKVNAEKLGAKILLTTVTALEFLNNKFDPFDLKLDGWSESIHENIDDYGEIFGELYEKYRTSTKVPPEIKLIMMIGGSAAMVHLTNTMFKSSLPGMEDMLKQNPEMMKQFAAAAQNQMNGSNPSAPSPSKKPPQMNMPPPPPVQTRSEMRGPSLHMPPNNQPNQSFNMGSAAPMRPVGPQMNFGSGLPAMPRREMKGPTGLGVDAILKEIQIGGGAKPPSPAKKSPSGSLVSKGNNQRRTINLNL